MDLMRSISGASIIVGRKAARSVSSFLGISEDNELEFWQQRFTYNAKNGKLAPSLLNLLPKRFAHINDESDMESDENEETTFGVKQVTTITSVPNRINKNLEMDIKMCSKSYSDSFVTISGRPAKNKIQDIHAESRQDVSNNHQVYESKNLCENKSSAESDEKSKISVHFYPSNDETKNIELRKFVLKNVKKYNPEDVRIDDEEMTEDNETAKEQDEKKSKVEEDVLIVPECIKCKGDWKKLEVFCQTKESNSKALDTVLYGEEALDYYQKMMETLSIPSPVIDAKEEITVKQNENKSGDPTNKSSSLKTTQQYHQVYKDYKPVFLTLITVSQLFVFGVLCYFGGIAPVGITPQLTYAEGVKTFIGTETVSVSEYPNVWIGPNAKYWIGVGAMYSPCMRQDHRLQIEFARQDRNYNSHDPLGCCEIDIRNTAGTTTQEECQQFTYGVGRWSLPVCSARASGLNSVAHIIKPCCVGLAGRCEMLTHEHCAILHGTFYQHDYEHCTQINCLKNVCKVGKISVTENTDSPNQWWRFFLPVFYHNGIIHLLLSSVAQWIVLRPIEAIAGSLRVSIIYFTCVFAGNLMSGIFTPYMPQVGATSSVCGFLGVTFIEIIQSRNLKQSTLTDFLKTLLILAIFLVSGTLPFVDNFAQVGGFVTGILTGIIFLPYVVFGRWDVIRRRLLVCVATPVLLSFFFMLMLIFYIVQSVEFCSWCHYLNCVPYTDSLCNHTWLTYQPF